MGVAHNKPLLYLPACLPTKKKAPPKQSQTFPQPADKN
jgi:hypothetical protein